MKQLHNEESPTASVYHISLLSLLFLIAMNPAVMLSRKIMVQGDAREFFVETNGGARGPLFYSRHQYKKQGELSLTLQSIENAQLIRRKSATLRRRKEEGLRESLESERER